MTALNESPELKLLNNKDNGKSPETNVHLNITTWLITLTPETMGDLNCCMKQHCIARATELWYLFVSRYVSSLRFSENIFILLI